MLNYAYKVKDADGNLIAGNMLAQRMAKGKGGKTRGVDDKGRAQSLRWCPKQHRAKKACFPKRPGNQRRG